MSFRACLKADQIEERMPQFGRSGAMTLSASMLLDPQFNTLLDLSKFPAFIMSAPINRMVLRDLLVKHIYESGRLKYSKAYSVCES